MLRKLADGTIYLLRQHRDHIKELNAKYDRIDSNHWRPRTKKFTPTKSYNKLVIVGKGPSLDVLDKLDIDPSALVIAINEVVHKVESLNLTNDIYCISIDANLRNTCLPKKAKLLVSSHNANWYGEYLETYIIDRDSGDLSVQVAIRLAKELNVKDITFLCFDSCVDKSIDYAKCVLPLKGDGKRFLKHKAIIEKEISNNISYSFLLPKNYFKKIVWSDPNVNKIISKFKVGSTNKTLFLPFMGEFGWFCMWHMQMVHQLKSQYKIVCCKKGEEIYFPSAAQFYYDWKDNIPDKNKGGLGEASSPSEAEIIAKFPNCDIVPSNLLTDFAMERAVPNSFFKKIPIKLDVVAPSLDVMLCTRYRKRAEQRNWKHWNKIEDFLNKNNYSFGVIGVEATSFPLASSKFNSWQYSTKVGLKALQNCKLYIGTDTGASHLAAQIGTNMLVFRHCSDNNWTDKMKVLCEVNKKSFNRIEAWEKPELVQQTIKNILG